METVLGLVLLGSWAAAVLMVSSLVLPVHLLGALRWFWLRALPAALAVHLSALLAALALDVRPGVDTYLLGLALGFLATPLVYVLAERALRRRTRDELQQRMRLPPAEPRAHLLAGGDVPTGRPGTVDYDPPPAADPDGPRG
ncbi:MAG: hypothetical protein ACLGIR_03500 [Actinomycetes bacterium]